MYTYHGKKDMSSIFALDYLEDVYKRFLKTL